LEDSFKYDAELLVEAYVEGRFFTQGVLEVDGELTALPPVEIIDSSGQEFKLYPGGSEVIKNISLTPEQLERINNSTLEAVKLTCVSGYARLDYHLSGGRFYLLEINAVPGLVPGYSSMTECAASAGYSYIELIEKLLSAAR
jgi:D-alanine-D-alanine ligase